MYICLRYQFLIILIIIGKLNDNVIAEALPADDESGHVPDDFMNFLKGLGSMVYTRTKLPMPDSHRTTRHYVDTTPKQHEYIIKTTQNINTQKAALRDALMLKLVSYYEDKYSLSHHEPVTTIPTDDDDEIVPTTKQIHMEIVQTPHRRPTVQFYNRHNRYQVSDVVVI